MKYLLIMFVIAPLYMLFEKHQDKKDFERSMEKHDTFMAGFEAGQKYAEEEVTREQHVNK